MNEALFKGVIELVENGCEIRNADDVRNAVLEAHAAGVKAIESGIKNVLPMKFLFLTQSGPSLTFTPTPELFPLKEMIGMFLPTIMRGRPDITAVVQLSEATACIAEGLAQKATLEKAMAEGRQLSDLNLGKDVVIAAGTCRFGDQRFTFTRTTEVVGEFPNRRAVNDLIEGGDWCDQSDGLFVPPMELFLPMEGEKPKIDEKMGGLVNNPERGRTHLPHAGGKPHTARDWQT